MLSLYWSLREAVETTPALSKCQLCIGAYGKQPGGWKTCGAGQNRAQCHRLMFISVMAEAGIEENIEESLVILVTSHIVLTRT